MTLTVCELFKRLSHAFSTTPRQRSGRGIRYCAQGPVRHHLGRVRKLGTTDGFRGPFQ